MQPSVCHVILTHCARLWQEVHNSENALARFTKALQIKLRTLAHVSRSDDVRAPTPGCSFLTLSYIYWNCLKVGQSKAIEAENDSQ